jgi:hypothetical protein
LKLTEKQQALKHCFLRGVEQYVPGIMDQFAGTNQRVQQQGDPINHKMQQQVDSIQALSQLVSMMSTQLPKKIHRLLDRVLKGALNGGINALDAVADDGEEETVGGEQEDGLGLLLDPEMEPTTVAAPTVPVLLARGAVNTTAVIPRPLARYTSILELCNDYNDRFSWLWKQLGLAGDPVCTLWRSRSTSQGLLKFSKE